MLKNAIEQAKSYHSQLVVVAGESVSLLLEHAASLFADFLHELKTRVLLLNHTTRHGEKTTSSLVYAVPSHPEYRYYKASDFGKTIFVGAGKNE